MAMEPMLPEMPIHDATLQVQLLNLGRILENPSLLKEFLPKDFSDLEIKGLIYELQSDRVMESKNLTLKQFLKRRGLLDWGDLSSGVKKELYDTQKRQSLIEGTITYALTMIDRLRATGSIEQRDREILVEAVDRIKGVFSEEA